MGKIIFAEKSVLFRTTDLAISPKSLVSKKALVLDRKVGAFSCISLAIDEPHIMLESINQISIFPIRVENCQNSRQNFRRGARAALAPWQARI